MVPYYQVSAFTRDYRRGNPAGVALLERWRPDAELLDIARENDLSETAFLVPRPDGDHDLRWFTPVGEIDLCGHATLASAHVLLNERGRPGEQPVIFHSASGRLGVARDDTRLVLDFPSRPPAPRAAPPGLAKAFGVEPLEVGVSRDLLVVLPDAAAVRGLAPDLDYLAGLELTGTIVTAPGDVSGVDFVSRFFAPREGIPEDPVTGSAHCTLIPYWAAKLERETLHARQVSPRGGELWCRLAGDRVRIGGHAVTYLAGELRV
jgi:PhzF family phenazine biosynthesis protein